MLTKEEILNALAIINKAVEIRDGWERFIATVCVSVYTPSLYHISVSVNFTETHIDIRIETPWKGDMDLVDEYQLPYDVLVSHEALTAAIKARIIKHKNDEAAAKIAEEEKERQDEEAREKETLKALIQKHGIPSLKDLT